MKVDFLICRQVCVYVLLEVLIRDLIPTLKLPVVLTLLLHRIIRKVNEPVAQVLQIKLLAGSADVSVLIEVTFRHSIDRSEHAIAPDVELPIIDQKRSLYVALYDMSMVPLFTRTDLLDHLFNSTDHSDTVTPI